MINITAKIIQSLVSLGQKRGPVRQTYRQPTYTRHMRGSPRIHNKSERFSFFMWSWNVSVLMPQGLRSSVLLSVRLFADLVA